MNELIITIMSFFMIMAVNNTDKIDRKAVVSRHNIVLKSYSYNNALQVGNGQIAYAVDITGMQSFDKRLAILTEWGWHSFPNKNDSKYEDILSTYDFYNHTSKYPHPGMIRRDWPVLTKEGYISCYRPQNKDEISPEVADKRAKSMNYFRVNPHRFFMGQIGMEIYKKDGNKVIMEDLTNCNQNLILWEGIIVSVFEVEGEKIEVETICDPKKDIIGFNIKSALLKEGRIKLFWDFPYMQQDPNRGADYTQKNLHTSVIDYLRSKKAIIKRNADDLNYFVNISWSDENAKFAQAAQHRFYLSTFSKNEISVTSGFNPLKNKSNEELDFKTIKTRNVKKWSNFWMNGGIVDLSGSKDNRWKELERRIILSQYLTAIQCCGFSPPQESGLFSNSWYGKFHLEMISWHGIHFALWNRTYLLENWMNWLTHEGAIGAHKRAVSEGYKGLRWNKMIDKKASWESPSKTGVYRLTQNGHIIYIAELLYKLNPSPEILNKYYNIVQGTADFMVDFLKWDNKTNRYVLGPPVKSGAECVSGPDGQNPTVELSYWAFGIKTAQKWRERKGFPQNKEWGNILKYLSYPPIKDSVYINMESHPNGWEGRPAWIEAYGCMPGIRIDPLIMKNTYAKIKNDYDYWNKWIWGCDFPMFAMCAARLGLQNEAIEWLLSKEKRNNYLSNGANLSGSIPYLPANGALLWAVAMMCAGWDGSPDIHAQGFPQDGSWNVKWEGLKPAL